MRRKLVILVETYFQQRDYRRYGIEVLQSNGLDVEVWEVFRPWRQSYAENYRPPDPSGFSGLRHFARTDEIINELGGVGARDALLVSMSNRWETAPIFRQLARQRAYFGAISLSGIAPTGGRRRFGMGTWRIWRDRFYLRLPHRGRRAAAPNFILLCGGTSLEPVARRLPKTEPVWTHALDYDIALELGTSADGRAGQFIVFLDECVPFHPDYLTMGIAPPNTPGEYYPKLNRFFHSLEERLRLPVVVAAHPRANYSGGPDYFEGRRVVQGQTGALVRDAALVITHSSGSNNFTAIYRKPLLVATTNGLSGSFYGPFIRETAEAYGAQLINLDEGWNLKAANILQVDDTRYARLVDRFVKRPGTPEKNTWQILSNYLNARTMA